MAVLVGLVLVALVGLVVAALLVNRPLLAVGALPLGSGIGPLEMPLVPGPLNFAHPLALGAVVTVVLHVLLVRPVHGGERRALGGPASTAVGAAVCYAAIVVCAALGSPFLMPYAGVTLTTVLAVGYALCLVVVTRSPDDVRFLLGCFVVGSMGATAPALLQAGGAQSQLAGAVVDGRATGAFTDPNELGLFAGLALVLALVFTATSTRAALRLIGLVAALVAFAGLVMSFSRLSWLATTVGLALLVGHAAYRRLVVRRFGGVLALGLLLAVAGGARLPVDTVLARLQSLGGATNPDDVRPLIWREGARLFWERPLFGWGPGAYQSLNASPPSVIWAGPVNHPHNGLLTVLVEQGVLGGVAVILLVGALVVGLLRAVRRPAAPSGPAEQRATVAWGLGAASALLLVNLTVDYALRNAQIMMTVWFLAGMLIAFLATSTGAETGRTSERAPRPAAGQEAR